MLYVIVNWIIIVSGNGLSLIQVQVIIWNSADSLSLAPKEKNTYNPNIVCNVVL